MNKRIIFFLAGTLISGLTLAQDGLSVQSAIEEALSNNPNIRISRSRVEIAENNASLGNAGLLPTLSAGAGVNYDVDDVSIQLAGSPDPIETTGAATNALNANLNLNYQVFSGFNNKRTYSKLQLAAAQSEMQSQLEVEGIILQVAAAFYNVLRAENNLQILRNSKAISESRVERSQAAKDLSGGSSIALLNAKVDLNQDSVELLNANQALTEARINFNQLLGRDLVNEVVLTAVEELPELEGHEALKEKMMSQNPTQINARLTEQSSLLDYKISNSSYLPQLNFSGSYSYFRNESEGSFLQLNETLGYGLGLTLSVPLFTGGTRRSAQKNAKILMENSKILNEETSRTLEKQLLIAYRDYQNSMQAFELEQTSLETAELNFELSEERFAIGQISNVDFRTARLNLLMSQNNLNNLQYNTQLTALEVLRLSGQLMK